MNWKSLGYIPVPYHRIQKAIAYAGKPFSTVPMVLGRLSLEFPKDDSEFRKLHLSHMHAARKISKSYQFTTSQCIELEIDTFYQYIVAKGKRGVSEKADFVCKILVDCNDRRLRKMLDTLIYLGEYDPAVILDKIYTNAIAPSTVWGEEEIGFYRDFMWDASVMTTADWVQYRSYFKKKPLLSHVKLFTPSASRGDLLTAADLSIGVGDTAMLARTRDILYERISSAQRSKNTAEIVKLSDSLNKNISLAARDLGDSTGRKKIQLALERVIAPLNGSIGSVEMIVKDDIPEHDTIGKRGNTEQLEGVLNGDYDPDEEKGEVEVTNVVPS